MQHTAVCVCVCVLLISAHISWILNEAAMFFSTPALPNAMTHFVKHTRINNDNSSHMCSFSAMCHR